MGLKLFTELVPDTENKRLLKENGQYKTEQGANALKIWIKKALMPEMKRFAYEAYSKNYGHEITDFLGRPADDNLALLIAQQVKECLCSNPYILNVSLLKYEIKDGKLSLNLSVETVYEDFEIKENLYE